MDDNTGVTQVVPFTAPSAGSLIGHPTETSTPRWHQTAWLSFRLVAGRLLNRCRIPGTIQPVSINDALSGQTLDVRIGPLFTCISVNGRDYYFRRLTGKWDGTGTGCS